MLRRSVDFPAPFAPTITVVVPAGTSKLIASMIRRRLCGPQQRPRTLTSTPMLEADAEIERGAPRRPEQPLIGPARCRVDLVGQVVDVQVDAQILTRLPLQPGIDDGVGWPRGGVGGIGEGLRHMMRAGTGGPARDELPRPPDIGDMARGVWRTVAGVIDRKFDGRLHVVIITRR